jgi:hypothetical protein
MENLMIPPSDALWSTELLCWFLFQKSSSFGLTYSADRATVASKKCCYWCGRHTWLWHIMRWVSLWMVPQRVAFSSQEDLHDQVHESSASCPLFSTVSGLCWVPPQFLEAWSNLFLSIRKPASEIMVERRWRWKGYEFGEIEEEWYKVFFWHGMQMYEDACMQMCENAWVCKKIFVFVFKAC